MRGSSALGSTGLRPSSPQHEASRRRDAAADFSTYAAALNVLPDLDLPDPKSVPVDLPVLVEEAKIVCTTGMLLCLDRKQRLTFTLGEILGVSDTVGSEIIEMSADNFRQCLTRARRDLYQFMNNQCGLVNASTPCRCRKKTQGSSARAMYRKADFRRGKRLGKDDHIVMWYKLAKPRSIDRETYAALPDSLTIRECRVQIAQPGFRVRVLVIATTLLDHVAYPPFDLAQLYRAR